MRAVALIIGLVLLGTAITSAGEVDPEPPAGSSQLRKVLGSWRSVRILAKGQDSERAGVTYTFGRDEFTFASEKTTYKGKLKVARSKPPLILELSREGKAATQKYAVKLEKGQLYLAPIRGEVPDKIDFSGNSYPILVLKPEQK